MNNAGIAVSAPLEFVPIDELRRQLEVNVIGQVAVTQAFLPALRRGRGRIVNVSSIGGRIALPLAGPYAASKFALEAISDSLRREVAPVRRRGVARRAGRRQDADLEEGHRDRRRRCRRACRRRPSSSTARMIEVLRRETAKIAEESGMEPERGGAR